ncbi:MAG: 16S rRNA (cytidine(1402)-2'-O)-methyltransferase [Salibaculum sp.]|uniref:16S rRNA (cytidine(1402)-2'-O)-methyltransferase n=2 Tax=Roseobacteraceae TaxID=2854170 RepID=UPI00286FD419|nr:16S rRNA (cytidine(1402)-2'-O)-methyltransferase [Salibaculum sp.]MDR9427581.1 16S rRNA (cytidine(1402)-2'-O)-methyltransferase [Salibaculum sp.]MDR9482169.1 16S rRNA (cytidine(1402)-2'-O)-methyltransferase [Salibaculum sp.]
MNHREIALDAGLYLVSTPIGNARDITLRALDVLACAGLIAAEDTRTARKLMEIHGLETRGRTMLAYHDHSGVGARDKVVAAIAAGQAVAYVSEAGTPLLADPGFQLARAVRAAGHPVLAVPGASALLAAVAVAGLPTDRFHFAGFLPNAQAARRAALSDLRDQRGTVVLYESPRRLAALVSDIAETLGAAREVVVCRELTKRFEERLAGPAEELARRLGDHPVKGECVVLIAPGTEEAVGDEAVRAALVNAMETMRVKDAANAVAGAMGRPRREVYQIALALKDKT